MKFDSVVSYFITHVFFSFMFRIFVSVSYLMTFFKGRICPLLSHKTVVLTIPNIVSSNETNEIRHAQIELAIALTYVVILSVY